MENETKMTQEERQLLLIDLSARFPYNVALDCRDEDSRFTCYLTTDILREIQNNTFYWEYKPYLFPLSSMTEEQKKEYNFWKHEVPVCYYEYGDIVEKVELLDSPESFEYLIENHFDYRGLIEKGLAIDATGLNIY